MKKLLLLSICIILSSIGFSQAQLENPGFEDAWETGGDISGTQPEPENWSSLKSADALAALAPTVAFQETTDPHSGTYCIRLLVVNSFGVDAAGLLTNGRVHADFNPELGYVWTETSDAQYNTAFTDRPDSLTFWVKHTAQNGDQSKVMVVLHEDPPTGQLPHDGTYTHWVGQGRSDITSDYATWTRLSVPFIYYNNNTPDYVLVSMSAGDSTIAEENTVMYIDDLELIYNPLSVSIDPSATQTIGVCSLGSPLTVTEDSNAAVVTTITREWKWSTTPGGPYSSFTVPETGTSYTPLFTTVDDFYVICETDFGAQGILTSNEVQITTTASGNTVSISPVANQNINANQDGTVLTATECPAPSSREWKWTTTSGSGYAVFSPNETGSTYTPNFATEGTYYVICESDFAGDIQESNEVTVIVAPEGTGIDELGVKIEVLKSESGLQVNYENPDGGAIFEVFNVSGKKLYNSTLSNGVSTHQLNVLEGIYIYRITSGSKIFTGKIKL
jgi:hypothetical protein